MTIVNLGKALDFSRINQSRLSSPAKPYFDFYAMPYLDGLGISALTSKHLSNKPIWIDHKHPDRYLTQRTLLQWTKRLAMGLDRIGSKRGEIVMLCTPNHIFLPVAYFGILGSGRVFSGANPANTVPEIVHQIKDSQARFILAHPAYAKSAVTAAKAAGLPDGHVFLFTDEPCAPMEGCRDWRSFLPSPAEAEGYEFPALSESEAISTPATVNYSSGTTGMPKGVAISHHNLIAGLEQSIFMKYAKKPYTVESRPTETWVGFLPLYHAYGQQYNISMALKLGITCYIMPKFEFEEFLQLIEKYGVTTLYVAPPILVMLAKRPETAKYNLNSVTDILCGAAPLSKELQNEVSRKLECEVAQGYGMTEVTCGVLAVPGGTIDDSGSVGPLFPNAKCMLLDEEGNEVPDGQPGELHFQGPNICLGYWRNPQATKATFTEDGWLKSGDVAVARNGWFWIVDRKKELIKVNGLQVAPAELEAALLEFDPIADAAAVGITLDDQEWPRAYIVLKDEYKGKTTIEDIQRHMKARVAKHKQLVGGIVFVDEVPKLQSGKIMRKLMRQWAKTDAEKMSKAKL
ncbi:4-coumarate- ligase 2 [Pyrenophora seminiperda CCB06]|uniref:4-coumarate-ligase 2 n=1 Tax=Pyrenophora seminiperda CCB06 TaxID=1302712 RepID=A0A3M7MEY7_9PLEO|nr:4-coumarate- ligase 2 [Pyrenophora seminiperda CCB06]